MVNVTLKPGSWLNRSLVKIKLLSLHKYIKQTRLWCWLRGCRTRWHDTHYAQL